MRLIKLTRPDNEPVYINPDTISSIQSDVTSKEALTLVCTLDGKEHRVSEYDIQVAEACKD